MKINNYYADTARYSWICGSNQSFEHISNGGECLFHHRKRSAAQTHENFNIWETAKDSLTTFKKNSRCENNHTLYNPYFKLRIYFEHCVLTQNKSVRMKWRHR